MVSTSGQDALLTRAQAADFLTGRGFPTTPRALDTLASRGGGPAYARYGARRVLYDQSDLIAWATSRLGQRQRSTSEAA